MAAALSVDLFAICRVDEVRCLIMNGAFLSNTQRRF